MAVSFLHGTLLFKLVRQNNTVVHKRMEMRCDTKRVVFMIYCHIELITYKS